LPGGSYTGGIQRMPAIFLGALANLAADDRAKRLLRLLTLEHGPGLSQTDLLGRGAYAHTRVFARDEQAAGQLLPGTHTVWVATGAQRDIQVVVLLDQVPQRPHPRVRLACAGIEKGVQAAWPALTQ